MLFLSWKSDFKKTACHLVLKPQGNGILNQVILFYFCCCTRIGLRQKLKTEVFRSPLLRGATGNSLSLGLPEGFWELEDMVPLSLLSPSPPAPLEFKWEGNSTKDWNHQVAGLMVRAVFLEHFSLFSGSAVEPSEAARRARRNQECLQEEPSILWWNTCWAESSGGSPWCCFQNTQGWFLSAGPECW